MTRRARFGSHTPRTIKKVQFLEKIHNIFVTLSFHFLRLGDFFVFLGFFFFDATHVFSVRGLKNACGFILPRRHYVSRVFSSGSQYVNTFTIDKNTIV